MKNLHIFCNTHIIQ